MHKLPAEIDVLRDAARLADDAYAAFRQAVQPGRRQYEVVADIEGYLRSRGCPDNFMIIGSGGKDVLGMTPPSERRIVTGDLVTTELTPALGRLFRPDLPHAGGRTRQRCAAARFRGIS